MFKKMFRKFTGSLMAVVLTLALFFGAIGPATAVPVHAAAYTYTLNIKSIKKAGALDKITNIKIGGQLYGDSGYPQTITAQVDSAPTSVTVTIAGAYANATISLSPVVTDGAEKTCTKSVSGHTKGVTYSSTLTSNHTHTWNNNSYSASGNKITATCQGSGTCDLTKPTLTLNASGKTYDGSVVTASLTKSSTWSSQGLTTPTITYSPANSKNVGTYTASAKVGNATATQQFTISPKTVTLNWGTNTFTYDGSSHVPTATASGIVSGDSCNVTVSGAQTDAGSYTATASNLSNSNYALPSANTKAFTITKKKLTLTGVTANNKVYDGTDAADLNTEEAALEGVVDGDDVKIEEITAVYTAGKAVGTGKEVKITATLKGAAKDNYELTPVTQTADITPKTVTVIGGIVASDKRYNGDTDATLDCKDAVLEDKIDGDDLGVSATGTFRDKTAEEGKTVTISNLVLTGEDAGNYALAASGNQTATTATIYTKEIKVSGITANEKEYDGTTDASINTEGASYDGIVGSDDVRVDIASAKADFSDKNVGTGKNVTVTFNLSGADKDNYTATLDGEVKGDITPKSVKVGGITVDTRAYDKTTDAPLNTSNATFGGKVDGDVLTVTGTGTYKDANAGIDKPASITGLALGGKDAGNYTVATDSQSSATGTVTEREIKVSGITASDKIYDGTTDAVLVLSNVKLDGKIDGDDLSLDSTKVIGAFEDKTKGTGKKVYISGLTLSGDDAKNYKLAEEGQQTETTASIGQLEIVVSNIKAKDKTYDGKTDAELEYKDAVLAGKLDGDDVTVSAKGSFSDKNVGEDKDVAITGLKLEGDDADNYVLAASGQQESATASITTRPVTVSGITADDKVYDGTKAATVKTEDAEFANIISGDTLTVSTTGTFDTKDVGTDKTVTFGELILGGESENNYELASEGQQSTAKADITPMPVKVQAIAASKAYGEDDPDEYEYTAEPLLGEDKYTGALSREPGETKGTYEILQGDLSAGNNYQINYTPADFTITQADNKVTASIEGWTYGDEANEPSATADFGEDTAVFTYSNEPEGEYSETVPTEAGTYYMKATIEETPNYKGAESVPVEFEIAPRVIELEWADTELVYNGEAQKPSATAKGLVEGDECEVTEVEGEQTDANAKTGEESYTATATKLSNPNYKLPDDPTTTFTIAPKPITKDMLTVENDLIKADGTKQGPTLILTDAEDMIEGEDYTLSGDVTSDKEGTHFITVEGTGNYTGTLETGWTMYGEKKNSETEQGTDGAGNIEIFVDIRGNTESISVDNFTIDFAKELLTEEELTRRAEGENILLYVEVVEKSADEVPAEDRALILAKFGEKDAKDIRWFDIKVWKKVGTDAATPVSELSSALKMSVTVPDEYKDAPANYTRTFYFGTAHGGAATIIRETNDKVVQFASKEFSTYALAYKDTKNPDKNKDKSKSNNALDAKRKTAPNTGDANNTLMWIMLLFVSAMAFTALIMRRRRSR